MLFRLCATALAVCALLGEAVHAAPLTLEEAWRIAEQANPALRAAQSAVHSAEGQLTESRALLWNNPEASYEGSSTRIRQTEERWRTWTFGLSQTFEIAGQQGKRREAAEAELASVQANIADARLLLRAEVEQRFVQLLALQMRSAVERETLSLVEQADAVMQKRLQAGEVSRLDRNVAKVEAERARNQLTQVEEQATQARGELASLLQLPPTELPEVAGDLQRAAPYTLDQLLAQAGQRQRLTSLTKREEAARSRLALERAAKYPDLTLGLNAGRDGPSELRENIVGFTVSLPLPIFRRNDAAVGKAMSELTQAQIERQAVERDTAAAVRVQWQRISQLEARARRLRESVLPTLQDNERLARRSFQEGEIGAVELMLVNRQLTELRRDVLEAELELRLARVALERASGWSDQPGSQTK